MAIHDSSNQLKSVVENFDFEKIRIGKIAVKNIAYLNQSLLIEVNKKNLPEQFDVYLFNNNVKNCYYRLNHFFKDNNLRIHLDSFLNREEQETGEWSFGVVSNFQEYTLLDSIMKLEDENSTTIIKDLESNWGQDELLYSGIYIKNSALMFCRLPETSYLNTTRNIINDCLYAKELMINESTMSFNLTNIDIPSSSIFRLILTSRSDGESTVIKAHIEDNKVKVFWESKKTIISEIKNGRYDVCGEILYNSFLIRGRIEIDDEVRRKRSLRYSTLNEEDSILLYTTDSNKLSIVRGKSHNVFREKNQVRSKITHLKKINNSAFQFSIDLEVNCKLTIEKAALKLRSKDFTKNIDITDIQVVSNEIGKYKIMGKYNIDWDKFFPLYWDLFIMVSDDSNDNGWIRVKGASKSILKKVDKDYFKWAVKSKDGSKIIYPYVTFGNDISFMMREREEYETVGNKVKEVIAYYTYRLLKPIYFNKKNIWLGFEKFSKTAQDNGYAFFSYVDKNKLHGDFYYIIDKNSPDFNRIKKESNRIVNFMSFKYLLLVYGSKLLVSSETKRHVHNIRIRSGRVARSINEKKSVFLQHGVTGLKKSDVFRKSKGRGNFDLVVATSEMEKEIINNNWNYDNDEIIITGFSRWDLLTDKSNSVGKRKIFFMPTWRTWMEDMPKEEFVKSEYYLNYMELLTSKELNQILIENNLELVYFLHPKFKQYISEFKIQNDHIKIKEFLDIKVNEEIMEASIMISDYSSVTWDMFYLNKPVIFYQFDAEKYMEYEGSYLNMEEELFGDRVRSIDELLVELKYYIEHDFLIKEEYKKLRNEYFEYTDRENSKRIFNEITKRIK